MAATNPANIINYKPTDFTFVRREKVHPGYFSTYKKFFRGTKWHVFLAPANDLEYAREVAKSREVNKGLWNVPGVYEYAVATSPTASRYKTYVGMTKHIRDRQNQYLNGDDHIKQLMEAALRSGLFVMRRIRYIVPKPELLPHQAAMAEVVAGQVETSFLGKFNYAWNRDNNGDLAMTRIPIKSSFLCIFSKIKWSRHNEANKFAAR